MLLYLKSLIAFIFAYSSVYILPLFGALVTYSSMNSNFESETMKYAWMNVYLGLAKHLSAGWIQNN